MMTRLISGAIMCLSIGTNLFAETITMHVGQHRDIELSGAAKVHVSRRGIIDLVYQKDDVWRATALKSGVVAVESRKPASKTETLYIDVTPRIQTKNSGQMLSKSSAQEQDVCIANHATDIYKVAIFVELIDSNQGLFSGGSPKVNIDLQGLNSAGTESLRANLSLHAQPEKSHFERKLISDPEILARPCEEIEVRTGGEDEYQISSSRVDTITTWKEHGLSLRLQIIPKQKDILNIPFKVALRTPSRGRGSYGLSEVQSVISTRTGIKTLAASVNLHSKTSSERSPWLLGDIPIIGPLLTGFDRGESSSKLLISFLSIIHSVDL